jgi:Holliday junction resolvase RusA-like endonuclease
MNKINIYITSFVTGMIILAISCSSPVQKAEQDVAKANEALEQAKLDSINDYQQFRRESEEKMTRNAEVMAAYQKNVKEGKQKITAADKKMMAELEQENEMMQMKLNSFTSESKEEWAAFKTEYNHDMDNLGKAIKDFTVPNTK